MRRTTIGKALVLAMALSGVAVLSVAQTAQKPSFEVASVKPSAPGLNLPRILGQPGGRFTATNTTLKVLMTVAYGVRDFQISGGPNWIATDRWNIEAQTGGKQCSWPA